MTKQEAMLSPLDYYPAPAVRLHLLREFARQAGFRAEDDIGARLGLDGTVFAAAESVARLGAETVSVNGKTKTTLELLEGSGEKIASGGRAYLWSKSLLAGENNVLPENDPTSARDAVLAATRAHFYALERDVDLAELGARELELIRACHDRGVRAGTQQGEPKHSLAEVVFEIRDEDLLGH